MTAASFSREDIFRAQGREEGREEGIEEGIQRGIEQGIEKGIEILVLDNIEDGKSKDEIIAKLQRRYQIDLEQAREYYEKYAGEEV